MHLINDEVVITGVGGLFPKAQNIEELQSRLLNNEELMETRWHEGERGVTNVIGKVATDFFDNAYFGIHRQQCTYMDPMHRLVLERTFEALIDAGVNPSELRGKRVGCFMGSSIGENDNLFMESVVSGFGVTGHSRAMMPNRVSYWLDLKGPSVSYDSNWVGGVEVLRLAQEAIMTGQCESVIVGTANLAMNSEFQWLYNDMGLLSPDGSTKSFDADAQGYGRSDGVVVLYLQKASQARRSYATVVNVATQFDGNREGTLLDIDVNNMVSFMDEFYSKVDVDPNEVEYVEAYGCGLKETDKKEIESLERVYCKNRKSPLLVGCIKPNTGHSEACSALFAVVKCLIAMETEIIPATIKYETPNPEIAPLVNGSIEVVTKNRPWGVKYAAINALGLDSYYGHILLRANPKKKVELKDDIPRLVLASTRTETGIKEILETIKGRPTLDLEYIKLIQDLYSKPILGHLYRGYAILGGEDAKQECEFNSGIKRQIWFVFSGMGSQWAGMLTDFMKLPVFANAINKCQKVLEPKGIDVIGIISNKDPSTYDTILNSFIGIAAIQIALTDVLKSIGIVPDGIIGHSVGELGCAYADGCMTAEQMILSAYSRGMASIEATLIKGMMAAIGLGYNQIKERLPAAVEVACHNGPDSCTLSGPTEDMEVFVKELQEQGTFARLVNVANIAYHSRYIKPAAPGLLKYLKAILPEPTPRSAKWISTSNKEEDWETDLAKNSSAEYHTNNLLSSVLFEEGLKHIPKDAVLIEIAPHGLLQAILKRSVKTGSTNIALTQRGAKSGLEFLLSALGKLYLAGIHLDLSNLFPKIESPVSRGTASLSNLTHWEHSEEWKTGLEDKLKSLYGVRDFHVTLNSEEFRECVGHQLDDKLILSCSSYLNVIYEIVANNNTGHKAVIFENLLFRRQLAIPKIGSIGVHAMIQKGSGDFELLVGNEIVLSGTITFPNSTDKFMIDPVNVTISNENVQLNANDIYNEFSHRGHKYSGGYKSLKTVILGQEGSVGVAHWNGKWTYFVEAMLQQHLLQDGERDQEIYVPKYIQKIVINHELLPTEKGDLEVHHDYATELILSSGIQIVGFKVTPMERDSKAISFDSLESIPFQKNTLADIDTGINIAVQLALTNFEDQFVTNIIVTEVESGNNSLLDNVKNVFSQYTKLNPNITSVKDSKLVIVQNAYPLLVILNDIINEELATLISSSHGFLLVRTDKNLLSYSQLIEVLQFIVNGVSYSILRRVNSATPNIVTVKGDILTIKDLCRNSASWVNELDNAVTQTKGKPNSVYLVSSLTPTEGMYNFAEELRSSPNMSLVKVLFSLGKREINLKDSVFKNVFKKDLSLTIIKDEVLGTILPVPLKLKTNIEKKIALSSTSLNKNIKYLGMNLRDETVLPKGAVKNELGNLDYSAVNTNGDGSMGIAHLDKVTNKLVLDPILQWDLPELWTLEDGATVPHAYISAYYCLFVKAKLKAGETVLIHSACSPISSAAISIALYYNCTVFTTVANEWQRAYIKSLFPSLRDGYIFSSNDTNFDPNLLMATDGAGAHVILNNLSGNLLQTSVACLAEFGRFIQIGKADLDGTTSIGMRVFLKNTSFYVVNLENVLNASKEVKMELKGMVSEGLENLSVRRVARKVVEHQNVDEILRELSDPGTAGKVLIKLQNNSVLNDFVVNSSNHFICDSKNSYLVYGGTSEVSTDVVEWLILRGARKIVIASDARSQQVHINRRLSLLQTYYQAELIFAASKAHNREGASELLSEVSYIGNIHSVFILPNKNSSPRVSDIKHVQYLDNALRTNSPKALLVNFIRNAAGIAQLRADSGYPTYHVQWQKDLEFNEALHGLDQILSYNITNIIIKNDKTGGDSSQETTQALFKKLTQILPASLEDLTEDSEFIPTKPDLIQLPTLGPREMRELSPVFIIPGLSGHKELREMAFKLLYPTFLAVLPSTPISLKDLAEALFEKILAIWPKGAYNIIGVSWGGALMVEIARLLEKRGASLHLYFIDAAPETLQSTIKHLGDNEVSLETNLLNRVLNINNVEVNKKISEQTSWNSRLRLALDSYEGEISDRKQLERSLLTFKSHLESLLTYQPSEELVSGQIHLIRPFGSSKYDNCGLVAYCKQTPQVTLVNGDHLGIINSPTTTEYINEKHYLV